MAKDLTKIALDNMKPGTARREIPDGKTRGLFLIVQPTGAKSWAVRYRFAGKPKKLTIGPYPEIPIPEARQLASEAITVVAKGEDPAVKKQAKRKAEKAAAQAPDDRDLVEKVVETFVERYARAKQKAGTARETERVLKTEVLGLKKVKGEWKEDPKRKGWRGHPLSGITRADVHALLDEIVDRGSPIMANRCLAAVRKMCAWAVDRGLIDASPCDKVKAPSAERSRDRVLRDDELKVVWHACDDLGWPFGPVVKLLALTGQRRDEVASMRWAEIDLEAKVWTLPRERAKNDHAHVIPLSDPVVAILKALPRIASKDGYVFTTNGRAPVSGFAKAKDRLDDFMLKAMRKGAAEPDKIELPRWTLHDLRRTFASGAARLGINLPVIEKVLNHVSGSFGGIVGVYQRHSFADEKRAALETWGRFVGTLVSGAPAGNVVELATARG